MSMSPRGDRPVLPPEIEREVLLRVLNEASSDDLNSARDVADAMWGAARALLCLRDLMAKQELMVVSDG